jgi:hypothetical protein
MMTVAVAFVAFAVAGAQTVCRLGFTYDISHSVSWGNGQLVVTYIYPYSHAATSGLRIYDIIEEIDGVAVRGLDDSDISARLNPDGQHLITLTATGVGVGTRPVRVGKECKPVSAIAEDQIAGAFAMYSVETSSERTFVCPFVTTAGDTASFMSFKTFSLPKINEDNRRLEEIINNCIAKELTAKGLVLDSLNSDMDVETFYFYKANANYKGGGGAARRGLYRYNIRRDRVERFPFLDPSAAETDARFLLELGIRMVDRRWGREKVVWESVANEMMSAAFRIERYAQVHIPLMLSQYPYVRRGRNVSFTLSRKEYNYTGLGYDINRLSHIISVDAGSPASEAGIVAGDMVERIDNISLRYTAAEYTAAYKRFISSTMAMRDPSTRFTDANGFEYCMSWDKLKYAAVSSAFSDKSNMTVFAYLYKYAPYINPSGVNSIKFDIIRGKDKHSLAIHPRIRTEKSLLIR